MEMRNYKIEGVELNWARLDKPVSPFGTMQYELQIATTDAAKADELRANYFNVKEKDGKFTVSLKRKAVKANGDDNGKVRVVDANLVAMDNVSNIGNGSVGNVIVFQYPYDAAGRKGVASSLTAVQITSLEVYSGDAAASFSVVGDGPAEPTDDVASMF